MIGNPPYKDKAKGLGGWIESGGQQAAPLARWQPPRAWDVGTHAKHLRNLYVYFWRWATWRVFGAGRETTQEEAAADASREGVICYITVAGFLNGPGFQKMRDGPAPHGVGDLGRRRLARGPPTEGGDAHLPGRPAARLHRDGGADGLRHRRRDPSRPFRMTGEGNEIARSGAATPPSRSALWAWNGGVAGGADRI